MLLAGVGHRYVLEDSAGAVSSAGFPPYLLHHRAPPQMCPHVSWRVSAPGCEKRKKRVLKKGVALCRRTVGWKMLW